MFFEAMLNTVSMFSPTVLIAVEVSLITELLFKKVSKLSYFLVIHAFFPAMALYSSSEVVRHFIIPLVSGSRVDVFATVIQVVFVSYCYVCSYSGRKAGVNILKNIFDSRVENNSVPSPEDYLGYRLFLTMWIFCVVVPAITF